MSTEENEIPVETEAESVAPESTPGNAEGQTDQSHPETRESKLPQSIPYKRFSQVVSQKNEMLQRNIELEQRIAELEGRNAQQQQDDFPNPEDYKSLEEYRDAVRKYADGHAENKVKGATQRFQESATIQNVVNSFNARAMEFSKIEPEIGAAIEEFKGMRSDFHPDVFHSIIADESGPELVWAIATDPELAAQLSNASPFQAGRILASLKNQAPASAPVAQAPRAQAPARQEVPATRTVRGAPPAQKTLAQIATSGTLAEYEAARRAGIK